MPRQAEIVVFLLLCAAFGQRASAATTVTFAQPVPYFVPGADNVTAADLDLDGTVDLLCASTQNNTNSVAILWGKGDGTFSAPQYVSVPNNTAGSISGIACADLSQSGRLDIVACDANANAVYVIKDKGNHKFGAAVPYSVGTAPYGVCVGDFKNDGYPDIATSNNQSDNISILFNNGSGGFGAATNYGSGEFPSRITAADLLNNGDLDLVASNDVSSNFSVYLGSGTGAFDTPSYYNAGYQ